MSSGGAFARALLMSGGVECWGSGYPASQPANATSIAVGRGHTCAIVAQSGTPSNVLYCWGDNSESEIGEGDVNTGAFPTHQTVPAMATHVGHVDLSQEALHASPTDQIVISLRDTRPMRGTPGAGLAGMSAIVSPLTKAIDSLVMV